MDHAYTVEMQRIRKCLSIVTGDVTRFNVDLRMSFIRNMVALPKRSAVVRRTEESLCERRFAALRAP